MGDESEQILMRQQFYGDGYEPSYTPLLAMATSGMTGADWDKNEYETNNFGSQTCQKSPLNNQGNGHECNDYSNDNDEETLQTLQNQTGNNHGFDQTAFQNELLTTNIKCEESDPFESQIPPNQDFIYQLDDMFDDSPQQVYIERVLGYLEGKEGLLTWYRNILINRLRGAYDNEIFQNVPVTRKSTNKSSSAYKYAKDCYALSLFLKGDMTAQVEEIFPTRGSKQSQSECFSSQHLEPQAGLKQRAQNN